MSIKLIDCTLRDGGHINKSNFGETNIRKIINNLVSSHVDIIELGFLKDLPYEPNTAVFNNVQQTKVFIKSVENVEYSLMAQEDQYDVSKLEHCDGTIKHIRVSFHNYDIKEGIAFARQVIAKGYKCHVNPINLQGYTDAELLYMIGIINDLNPDTFTIVDTFGAMTEKELNRIFAIIDNNLNININVGLHLHENLGLSFSLAQFFTRIKPPTRNISIDASLNGMGRVPGNLNLELIMDYMNRIYNKKYDINPIYDAIDDFIIPIKRKLDIPWGYSLPYALSAKHGVHRTYAEFLISKTKLKTKDIQTILASIAQEHKSTYNKNYIQKLYFNYLCHNIDDSISLNKLKNELNNKDILLIAPGATILSMNSKVCEFIAKYHPVIISANFSSEDLNIKPDYIFCSNIQRYELLKNRKNLIITSNLLDYIQDADYILNFKSLIPNDDEYLDNALILLLQMLKNMGVSKVNLAGFDGFVKGGNNYFESKFLSIYDPISTTYKDNNVVKDMLIKYFSTIKINTLTPSYYIKENAIV